MPRPKGSKNKPKPVCDGAFEYTLEQRMKMVADLVVEKLLEDQSFGRELVNILDQGVEDVSNEH